MTDPESRTTKSPTSDSPTMNGEPITSAIEELRSAFPTILLLEKERPSVENEIPNVKSPIYPRWTGSFTLLSFPRELRDNIYFHYLHRHQALTWRRRPNHGYVLGGYSWRGYTAVYAPGLDTDILRLFLVSQQVYKEALYVFCSSNTIFIERRKNGLLEGSLRLFPGKAASMLQNVELGYSDYDCSRHAEWYGPSPSRTWERIVRDALVAKEHLPRLTEYTALWDLDWRTLYDKEGMASLQTQSEDVKVQIWLRWFKRQGEAKNLVPPTWLKVRFSPAPMPYHYWPPMSDHQEAWNRALAMLKEGVRGEKKGDELEESGKKWLEEEWGDGRRVRKGKAKDVI